MNSQEKIVEFSIFLEFFGGRRRWVSRIVIILQLLVGHSVFLSSRIFQSYDQVGKTIRQVKPNMVSSTPRINKNGDPAKEAKNELLGAKVFRS